VCSLSLSNAADCSVRESKSCADNADARCCRVDLVLSLEGDGFKAREKLEKGTINADHGSQPDFRLAILTSKNAFLLHTTSTMRP
jgi:hypothetical protein